MSRKGDPTCRNRPGGRKASAALLIALLVAALLGAPAAWANGGTIQVAGEVAGPYAITVYTSPSPIRVGLVDVSVMVERAGTKQLVPDAQITITAEPLSRPGPAATFAATHEQATNSLYYAADVDLSSPGMWRLTIQVAGAMGEGKVEFSVEAAEPGPLEQPLAVAGLAALPIVVVVVLWYFRASANRSD